MPAPIHAVAVSTAALAFALAACSGGSGGGPPDATPGPEDVLSDTAADVDTAPEVSPEPDPEPADVAPDTAPEPDPGPETELPEDVGSEDGGDSEDADVGPPPPPFPGWSDLHDLPGFEHPAHLLEGCDLGEEPIQCKFVLTGFSGADTLPDFFLESAFYSLHDEWYWFRLLNGVAIEGLDVDPVPGLSFETIADVYAELLGDEVLPLDLKFTSGGRLYSPKFYELGLTKEPRFFGLGSVLYLAPNEDRVLPEALWLFELEFTDYKVTEAQIGTFFERIEAMLPEEVRPELRWLVRSTPQEALGKALQAGGGPYSDRIVTYADLVVAGNVEVYNAGITAGKLALVPKGTVGGASVGPDRIAILAEVPDYLPPVAGIVTSVPQTPLAHLNLLAKSRGTPNAHVAGVFEDDQIDAVATWKKPILLKVADGAVTWKQLTASQYDQYLQLKGSPDLQIPQVDLEGAPYVVPLPGDLAKMKETVPLTGGKAAGMMALASFPDMPLPDVPIAVSIKAYVEHVAFFDAVLDALLADDEFEADARVRFVVLEGHEDFALEHAGDPAALVWLEGFLLDHPPNTPLGSVVSAGGLKALLRSEPISPPALAEIESALAAHFDHLAPTQGLRFRSSSTAEDVQGFNGAGLYDSNTGFLHPDLQPDPKDQDESVEKALKKTWASYWAYEAFEERRAAGIDHLSGAMGVLVHPRFDDEKELANGVILFSYARDDAGDLAEMVVNVQDGATSITNPVPGSGALPEIDRLVAVGPGAPDIERLQPSTEVPPGAVVLDDAELLTLFDLLRPLADAWIDQSNLGVPLQQHRSTVVLDLEFKRMAKGWPALKSGESLPERLVVRQVRVLDSPNLLPPELAAEPIPLDVQEKTTKVQLRTCTAGPLVVEALEAWTDPAKTWALDYSAAPFDARLTFTVTAPLAEVGLVPGPAVTVYHGFLTELGHPAMAKGKPWDLHVVLPAAVAKTTGFHTLDLVEGATSGSWSVASATGQASGPGCSCQVLDLLGSPTEYLESLLLPAP